jgi:hypothetical protein
VIASIAAVNVLAVIVIARLWRRLSGTEHERPPVCAHDASARPARITDSSPSHRSATASDFEGERQLGEPAEGTLAADEDGKSIAGHVADG